MRYAILADVHANLEALTAVLRALDAHAVDRIVCLGDLVGYHTNPNECVSILAVRGIPCVLGNHDAVAAGLAQPVDFSPTARRAILWTQKHLSGVCRHYLRTMPLFRVIDQRFVAVHGALHPVPNDRTRLRSDSDAQESFQVLKRDFPDIPLCFFGHVHRPAAYELRNNQVHVLSAHTLKLQPDACYLINPGSVGQSRDDDPRAAFAIFDADQQSVEFCRVDYDRSAARLKLQRAGLITPRGALRRSASWIKRSLLRTVKHASAKTWR